MSRKTIVILQSNYIPWKGYFDLMAVADEFLLFDEVQYTKNDWRNRNRIVLDGKLHWLTLPVRTAGKFGEPIDRMEVSRSDWAKAHWETLRQAYSDAPFYKLIGGVLEEAYALAAPFGHLSRINEHFLRTIAGLLALDTVILRAEMVPRTTADATDRLLEICRARGATDYVSGPAARNYLRVGAFQEAGIALHFANYGGYPVYRQLREPFEHGVSMIDTLMQCGSEARHHLKALSDRSGFLSP
jgi:WbqC-like protein